MLQEIPRKSSQGSELTRNLRAFILNRDKRLIETTPQEHKHLDTQMLFNDMETILKSMDQADARVQRITAKLHELKTAVLLSADNY